jgi:tight adherence protein B
MQGFVLLLVFFGTALLVLGTYALVNRRRLAAAEVLRRRMGDSAPIATQMNILRDDRRSSVGAIDTLLDSMKVSESLEYELLRAGATWTVGEFVLGSAVAASVLMLLGQQFGFLTAWIGTAVGAVLPFLILRKMQANRKRKFEDQLPDAIDMIVNAMRAGFSFQAALKFVGDEVPSPLGEEFTRVYDEQRLGADTRVALLSMQDRVGTLDAKMFVTSLLIQRETGGNLSEVLSGLATLIRDRGAQVRRSHAGVDAGCWLFCAALFESTDDASDADHDDRPVHLVVRGRLDRGGVYRSDEDRRHRTMSNEK